MVQELLMMPTTLLATNIDKPEDYSSRFQVSPVDGKILNFGTVDGSIIEQVKGVHYSLDAFLGSHQSEEEYMIAAKQSHDGDTKKLHHIIVYLAPGDCHHFYSPADWRVSLCRHLPGEGRAE